MAQLITQENLPEQQLILRNEDGVINVDYIEAIEAALSDQDTPRVLQYIENLHASDLGDLLQTLTEDDAVLLIEKAGSAFDFEALTEVDDTRRERILDRLPTKTVVDGVRELDLDDAVYILEDLEEAEQAEILAELPATDRVVLERSLDYPEDSAGRRMQTDFVAIPPFWTVGQTIDYLREASDLPDNFYEIFVVDPGYRLLGDVPLDRLLRTKRPQTIQNIMTSTAHPVYATDDQEDVARMFERYNLVSTAVLDDGDRLVGMLTADDIVDVIEQEAEEDLKALAGVKADEEISDSVFYITKSRFTWLLVNLFTAIFASMVISYFESSLQKIVALAILMPIVASQGGNAGTQTMAVTVRALATENLSNLNMARYIFREISVGFFNGLLFALIMSLVAVFWFGSVQLGVVIAFAMLINMVAAGLAGVLIPITLEKMNYDPAVASGPFVTTITDVVGFLAFLGFATWWLAL